MIDKDLAIWRRKHECIFDLFVFLKGKDSKTIQMNEKSFYPKDFFLNECNVCYGCLCKMHVIMPTHESWMYVQPFFIFLLLKVLKL